MTETVKKALALLRSGDYKADRIDNTDYDMTERLRDVPVALQNGYMMETMLKNETPRLLPEDRFGFHRSQIHLPKLPRKSRSGWKLRDTFGGNFTPNYRRVMEEGLDALAAEIEERRTTAKDEEAEVFYESMARSVRAVIDVADRYRLLAEKEKNETLHTALCRVPRKSPRSFYEACLFMKILIYALRSSGVNHMTLGRFDQYMLSYYEADRKRGLSCENLLETLELFFISINLDSDLYVGIQTGDNGQSMVLGGFDKEGNSLYNELSDACMDASLELSLIDPKINLRVGKKTPDWIYEKGTKLTKQGLGFPQYCNDDIIVPYMLSLGYDEEDAYDYAVAACWEVISPNNGADEDNREVLNYPLVVQQTVAAHLTECASFEELLERVTEAITERCEEIRRDYSFELHPELIPPRNLFASVLVDGCLEKGRDHLRGGAKYTNYGCHGAGISNATDALAAIRQVIYEEKSVTPEELLRALEADFEGYEPLRNRLLACPKMGNNDDRADSIAHRLMTAAEDAMHGKPNGRFGGVWRMGTGSAMEYVRSAKECPATADGRHAGDVYGCSFSPSVLVKLNGPLSVIQSFTKHPMNRCANGGPTTLELHDTVFRNEEGEKKVAALVKAFIRLGGHQLQLNSINRDRLLEAQKHPELHKNLIVRVWGWSGYFCELDPEYQNHIIRRTEFTV